MPAPTLVRPVVLVPSLITPAKVVELLSPPVVSVAAAVPLLVTTPLPLPASDPIVEVLPLRSSVVVVRVVAPVPTVNAELPDRPVVEPACSVPSTTVVAPE